MKIKNKTWIIWGFILLVMVVFVYKGNGEKTAKETYQQIKPVLASIKKTVSTTGTVSPQNRLEIKPPIAGRIEKILVEEGQIVKTGDVLALMSSTDRAALLDAAGLKDAEEVAYWQDVYKAAPLITPIDGKVIVRAVEPGQTVTTSEAVIVLSDRLIIKADVDETDIGMIKVGQKAIIGLDAYPDIKADAIVDHISYESELVNNVNIYTVEIVLEAVPDVFRSGMSANVEIITLEKQNVLTLPIKVVQENNGNHFVMIKDEKSKEAKKVPVQIGMQDEKSYEILSGLSQTDLVLSAANESFSLHKNKNGSNPFMPDRGKK
ncbi:MAG: efflux RND transporter periplasmic adaptor subunit [Candidatus Omnitrophica bacterium]|nr:efflux RND transporter periplasmic adaptor subunit [Candidatus Omnitrophota bacterium]